MGLLGTWRKRRRGLSDHEQAHEDFLQSATFSVTHDDDHNDDESLTCVPADARCDFVDDDDDDGSYLAQTPVPASIHGHIDHGDDEAEEPELIRGDNIGPYDIDEIDDDFFDELDIPAAEVYKPKHDARPTTRLWTQSMSVPFPASSDVHEMSETVNGDMQVSGVLIIVNPVAGVHRGYTLTLSVFAAPADRKYTYDDSDDPLPWSDNAIDAMEKHFRDHDGLEVSRHQCPWGTSLEAQAYFDNHVPAQRLMICGSRGPRWVMRATVASFGLNDTIRHEVYDLLQDMVVFRGSQPAAPGQPLDVSLIDRREGRKGGKIL